MRSLMMMGLFAVVVGCGGSDVGDSSGVTPTKKVHDLTDGEGKTLCQWGIAVQGGPNQQTDCNGTTVKSGTEAECEAAIHAGFAHCEVTVGQVEGCMNAQAADPCAALESELCAPLWACQ